MPYDDPTRKPLHDAQDEFAAGYPIDLRAEPVPYGEDMADANGDSSTTGEAVSPPAQDLLPNMSAEASNPSGGWGGQGLGH